MWELGEPEPVAATTAVMIDLPKLLHDEDDWIRACAAFVTDPTEPHLKTLAATDPNLLVRTTAQTILSGAPMKTLATLSRMERILFLRRVPLFSELAPSDLQRIANIANERAYPDGATIVTQGEPGEEMYIITTGEVSVKVTGKEVARRKVGEVVGEMSIISREPRVASLLAVGEVRTLYITREQFESLLRERPEVSLGVMQVLCARLKELSN